MLEGYRAILAALIGAIAQGFGITLDVDALVQAILLIITTIITVYFKVKANSREEVLKLKIKELKND